MEACWERESRDDSHAQHNVTPLDVAALDGEVAAKRAVRRDSVMPDQRQKDQHRDRHAQKPQQKSSTQIHVRLLAF